MAITFKKRLLPPTVLTIINIIFGIFFFFFGIAIMSGIFILIGLTLTQCLYLLRNENQGKETMLENIELMCIYFAIFAVLTKTSGFFER